MPACNKPGLDWPEIKRLYENGTTAYGLANKFPVTKQGIMKRAAKEGWVRQVFPEVAREWLPVTRQVTGTHNPAEGSTKKSIEMIRHFGKRTPQTAAKILAAIESGMPLERSAKAAGISKDTLDRWRYEDADFAASLETALGEWEENNHRAIKGATQRGDWKAAAWSLERHPSTRGVYADPNKGHGGGPAINVVLNIGRAQIEASQDDQTITITPGGAVD